MEPPAPNRRPAAPGKAADGDLGQVTVRVLWDVLADLFVAPSQVVTKIDKPCPEPRTPRGEIQRMTVLLADMAGITDFRLVRCHNRIPGGSTSGAAA